MVLPDLQGWAAAHILAHTQPADTQPAQPGRATSAGFTALVNAPETHLGFSVLALTLPTACTPNQGDMHESSTFLLPYTEGQVEALLQTPMARANKSERSGFRLTSGTTRDHEHASSLKVELLAQECPLTRDTVRKIWAGPGGIAPLAWCLAHKITDPLSHLQVRKYYWHHFGVAITNPTDSVHMGSIYLLSYNFWSLAQTSQFIEGVAVSPDSSSPDSSSHQPLEDSSAAGSI
jgi:hypothetical protein